MAKYNFVLDGIAKIILVIVLSYNYTKVNNMLEGNSVIFSLLKTSMRCMLRSGTRQYVYSTQYRKCLKSKNSCLGDLDRVDRKHLLEAYSLCLCTQVLCFQLLVLAQDYLNNLYEFE